MADTSPLANEVTRDKPSEVPSDITAARAASSDTSAGPSSSSAENARDASHLGQNPEPDAAGLRIGGHLRSFAEGQLSPQRLSSRLVSPYSRSIFMGVLILFLLIPLGFVRDVVHDRMKLYQEATGNITDSWGRSQTVSGPALIIPFEVWEEKKEKVVVSVNGYDKTQDIVTREPYWEHKVVLPADLNFVTEMNPEVRYRGIYRQALYSAPVSASGTFNLPAEADFGDNIRAIHWNKAYLSIGVTDLKAIAEAPPAVWNGAPLEAYKPGTDANILLGAGFHTAIPLSPEDAGATQSFLFRLRIRGSEGIYFTPTGESTTIAMTGTWPSPSFQGNLLPVERAVTDQGFSAKWVVSNLTRTYPQMANLSSSDYTQAGTERSLITNFTAGVDLHEPVTLYRMVRRSVDYGILFIAVTFVALFAFEIVSRQRIHLIQYAMVGVSMSVFYLVLLSLAEHVSFGLSFVTAGALIVAMNGLYIASVMQSRKKGIILASLLTGLYAVLFSLLRMEDFSLIMGTGLVLVMMGALMLVTRKLPQIGEPDMKA